MVSVLHLEIIKCLALGRGLRQGPDTLNVAGGEEAVGAVQLPVVPVLVYLAPQNDDVPLVELKVTRFFPLVVVQGLAIGQLGQVLKAENDMWLLECFFSATFF